MLEIRRSNGEEVTNPVARAVIAALVVLTLSAVVIGVTLVITGAPVVIFIIAIVLVALMPPIYAVDFVLKRMGRRGMVNMRHGTKVTVSRRAFEKVTRRS